MKRKWITAIALGLVTTGALAGQELDQRYPLAADGLLTVVNIAGDIEITTWDREEVHLTGELGERSELDVRESANSLRIEVKPENRGRHHGNLEETDLLLRVPVAARLSVSGVSSDVTVSGSRAASLSVETVSGDVEVRADVERLELSSVSGDVEFSGTASRTTLESVSGDIEVEGLAGDLETSLVSGDLELRGGRFNRGKFESVSGTLEIELELEPGGRLSVESMSGDVVLRLPAGQSAEFEAQSFSGDIRSRFGSSKRQSRGPGSQLRHVAGDGGASIRVESFSGDIEIGHK